MSPREPSPPDREDLIGFFDDEEKKGDARIAASATRLDDRGTSERARPPIDPPRLHTARTRRLTDDLEGLTAAERAKPARSDAGFAERTKRSPLFCRLRKVYRTRQGPDPERRLGGEPPSRGRRECSGTRNTMIFITRNDDDDEASSVPRPVIFPSSSRRSPSAVPSVPLTPCLATSSACAKSAQMSSMCSIPTETRIMSCDTPDAFCSASVSCSCVVDAGWMTNVLASPTLASWDASLTESMNLVPAARPPLTPKVSTAPWEFRAEVLVRAPVVRMVGQAGIRDPGDHGVRLEELGQRQGVGAVPLHAQAERLEAEEEVERPEGALAHPHVAQALDAAAHDERDVHPEHAVGTERVPEPEPVVSGGGFREDGVLPVVPVHGAAVDDDAAHGSAVPADPLRGGLHDNVRAVPQGLAAVPARAEGVVADERNAVLLRHRLQGAEVRHGESRVADGLHVDRLGVGVDERFERVGLVVLRELDVDAQPGEGHLELIVRAAVERGVETMLSPT